MSRLLFILSFVISTGHLSAQANSLFELGNEKYQAGEYMEAIELYDSIQKMGFNNEALYYNLGNAHYQSGRLAWAILYYEKALLQDPHDEEIKHNLALANSKRIDRFEIMPENLFKTFRLKILRALSPDQWAMTGLILLALAIGGLSLYLFSSLGRIGFVALISGGLLSLFSITMAYSHKHYIDLHPELIIMSDAAYVKSGPGENAEDLFILHAGTKVLQVEQFESWCKIRLVDGKIGWLPRANTEAIR